MNFLRLSVRNCTIAALCATIIGCGDGDGSVEFDRGKNAYELGDLKKAEKCFAASIEAAPQEVDRLIYLARVKLDLGELAESRQLIERAEMIDGDAADVRMLSAQVACHSKDYKKAAEIFLKIANDANLDSVIRSQAFAGLGVVEMSCENLHLARIDFLRALRLDRRNASAYYHLGLLYRDGLDRNGSGYYEAALEQLEMFVRLNEDSDPRIQKVQKTIIPGIKEMIAQATASRPGAAKRDSAACATLIAQAEADFKKGAFKSARKNYAAALAADPLSDRAALNLAKCWEKTDATKDGQLKALECYQTVCVLRPSATVIFLTTGNLAMKLGKYALASEIYSRAIAANPTSKDAIDGLIRALQKLGNRTSVARAYQAYRDSLSTRK